MQSLIEMRGNSQQTGTRKCGCRLSAAMLALLALPFVSSAADSPDVAESKLVLVGTVVRETGEAIAIIEVGGSAEQRLYRPGDFIDAGQITGIQKDSVMLAFPDGEIELRLASGAPTGLANSGDTYRVQPLLRQGISGFWRIGRDTLDDLSRAGELVSHTTPVGDEGVRIDRIQANGLFQMLGLREGDIIRNINGAVPKANRSLVEEIASGGMDDSTLRLEIERDGHFDAVYYEIAP